MLTKLMAQIAVRLPRAQKGQDAAEYALLIGLIALVIFVGVSFLGENLNTVFNNLATTIAGWF